MIAKEMAAADIDMTHEQCASKYKALKQLYKACIDCNNGSGNGRKTFQYFEVSVSHCVSIF